MTDAPKLPDILIRLAELVPERVRVKGDAVSIFMHDHWQHLTNLRLLARKQQELDMEARLEYALRKEIESRGWRWWTFSRGGGLYGATVYVTGSEDDGPTADTPAHALALALLKTLETHNADGRNQAL